MRCIAPRIIQCSAAIYICDISARLKYWVNKRPLVVSSIIMIEKINESNFNCFFNSRFPCFITRWQNNKKKNEKKKIKKYINFKYNKRSNIFNSRRKTETLRLLEIIIKIYWQKFQSKQVILLWFHVYKIIWNFTPIFSFTKQPKFVK